MTDNIRYGILREIAIYFYGQVDEQIAEKLSQLIGAFLQMTGGKFTRKAEGDRSELRLIRGGWKKILTRCMERELLHANAITLLFSDCEIRSLQNNQCFMALFPAGRENILPNSILFQCPDTVTWVEVSKFIRLSGDLFVLHYAAASKAVVDNRFHYPGGAGYSQNYLRENPLLTSEWSEWGEGGFWLNAKQGIPCPAPMQFLGRTFTAQLNLNLLEAETTGIHMKNWNDGVWIDLCDRIDDETKLLPESDILFERLRRLNRLLAPIILTDRNKPVMFWKPEQWDKWRNRFDF